MESENPSTSNHIVVLLFCDKIFIIVTHHVNEKITKQASHGPA
jgi:hypothetical protein